MAHFMKLTQALPHGQADEALKVLYQPRQHNLGGTGRKPIHHPNSIWQSDGPGGCGLHLPPRKLTIDNPRPIRFITNASQKTILIASLGALCFIVYIVGCERNQQNVRNRKY